MSRGSVAMYLRLSLEDINSSRSVAKDESNSITNQRSIVTKFIESNKELNQLKKIEFVDDGFSGTNFDRPDFKRMINMVRSGEISCIVVKDLSRFARNYIDAGDYLEHIFPLLGVRFIAVNDNYDSNKFIGTTGGMDVAFRNFMYELYSTDISKKVKASQHMLMRKGKYVSHCPYGYMKPKGEKHRMIPDPETAPVVRDIFLWAANGHKSTEIAGMLNERNIPTPMQHKNISRKDMQNRTMWSHQAVIRIIKDYKYTGAMVSFKCGNETVRAKVQKRYAPEDYVINEGMHEAIVSHDEYYAANDSLRKVKSFKRSESDCRDRVYYCGHCGRRLRKTFGYDEYYSCTTSLYTKNTACSEIKWSRKDIENVVFQAYKQQLQIISEEYHKAVKEVKPNNMISLKARHKSITLQIKGITGEVASLYEKYRENELTKDDFFKRKEQLSEEKNRLDADLDRIKTEIDELLDKERRESLVLQTIENAANNSEISEEEKRSRMYQDIEKVIVFDNENIKIIWKFNAEFSSV